MTGTHMRGKEDKHVSRGDSSRVSDQSGNSWSQMRQYIYIQESQGRGKSQILLIKELRPASLHCDERTVLLSGKLVSSLSELI